MTIAHDTHTRFPSTGDGSTATGNQTFSHAGSASTAGVAVVILSNAAADPVTGVTYANAAMTLTREVVDTGTGGDQGNVQIWTLTGQDITGGTQDVVLQGCTSIAKLAVCFTVTSATGQTEVNADNGVFVSAGTNPTVSVTTTKDAMLYGGWHSGASSNTSTVVSGTTEATSTAYGTNSGRICRSTAVRSSGSNSLSYTFGTSDNYDFGIVALAEAAPPVNADPALSTATSNAPGLAVQAATTYDKVVVGDTPVSFWNDDSGTDAIGLSNLTKFNSPTSTQAPDGTNCMVFNGTNQYAEGTDQNAYSIPTTGRLTFEAWIRPDVLEFPDTESTGYVNWAGKTGAGATNDAEWLTRMYSKTTTDVPPRPHRVSGYAFNPDGGLGTGGYFEDPLALGEWIHVVFVVNKADAGGSYPDGYGKLYKNGVLRRQENLDVGGVSITPGNGTAPFRIGSARAQSSFFKGAIAKPAIYSYELTAAQILEHYNTMKLSLALSQDAAVLVGPGAQAASSSASANNATVTTTGGGEAPAEVVSISGSVGLSSRLVSISPRTA